MRRACLLAATLLLTACGGRTLSVHVAKDMIAEIPPEALDKKDVDILGIRHTLGSEAIVETNIKTAFRFEKVGGKWLVRDIRLGDGQWVKVDDLLQVLDSVRIEATQKSLDLVAEAILKYREAKGSMPAFLDYVSLSDMLSPVYLTPLVRVDAWGQPLLADHPDLGTILLQSAGPDRKFGTADDIRKTVQ